MKCACQYLPGLVAVGWVDCRKLTPELALRSASMEGLGDDGLVGVHTDVHVLGLAAPAELSVTTEADHGGTVQTASLTFATTDTLPADIPLAFAVRDVRGRCFLVGAFEAPYPTVKAVRSSGKAGSESAVTQVEVKHTAVRTALPCLFIEPR